MNVSDAQPRLRTVEKYSPPYPMNKFPEDFYLKVGKQVIYLLMTKPHATLEGNEWEQVFARAVGARWKPSNTGLDDILLNGCAWGAKTVKSKHPWSMKSVRLISGRNSPVYSYGDTIDQHKDPAEVAKHVVAIWNERVASLWAKYKHLRTVVLLKSENLLNLTVFEFETVRYDPNEYTWSWNKNGNLVGLDGDKKRFTWQPHGSQFTIIEPVPECRACISLKQPPKINQENLLAAYKFDSSWVEVIRPPEEGSKSR